MDKLKKHSNKDVPSERQMLYILRNYTRLQDELVAARKRIAELDMSYLAWQNGRLRTRIEKGQSKYDHLKGAYNRLLKCNNRRKEIMKSAWDYIPDDIKRKFEQNDTSKFEDLLDDIDNENVV